MRKIIRGISVCVIVAAVAVLFQCWRSTLPPVKFLRQSSEQHERFATACAQVLAANPIGTNGSVRLPVSDMPAAIAEHDPTRITVSSNRFHMLVGGGRDGFGVAWQPSGDDPNVWELWHYWDGDMTGPLFTGSRGEIGQQDTGGDK